MRSLLAITKALADENRLRAVAALNGRELCLCQVVELLGLATSTVSRHMAILQQAQLISLRKEGRWAYFRLANGEATAEVRDALQLVLGSLKRDPQARQDRQKVKDILKQDPEELCRRQGKCKSQLSPRRPIA